MEGILPRRLATFAELLAVLPARITTRMHIEKIHIQVSVGIKIK
jgi:hypothetical protein